MAPESSATVSCSSIMVAAVDSAETTLMSVSLAFASVPNAALIPVSALLTQGSVMVRLAAAVAVLVAAVSGDAVSVVAAQPVRASRPRAATMRRRGVVEVMSVSFL